MTVFELSLQVLDCQMRRSLPGLSRRMQGHPEGLEERLRDGQAVGHAAARGPEGGAGAAGGVLQEDAVEEVVGGFGGGAGELGEDGEAAAREDEVECAGGEAGGGGVGGGHVGEDFLEEFEGEGVHGWMMSEGEGGGESEQCSGGDSEFRERGRVVGVFGVAWWLMSSRRRGLRVEIELVWRGQVELETNK